jgi:hypothetical protein
VLENVGFTLIGTDFVLAPRFGVEVGELVLRLD